MEPDLRAARAACTEFRWTDARTMFGALELDVAEMDVDDLNSFATASYLTGRDEDGFALWARAHQRCADDGAAHRAAYFGAQLAECLCFKGDMARARGWVDRTARLLGDAAIDCVEQGYLEHALGMIQVFEYGDLGGARSHFERAGKIATRFRDRQLATLARIGEGRMMVYLGEPAEGLALLDEAIVSVETGELSPVATGDAYCTVIEACAELSDLVRSRSWTASMQRWCDQHQDLVLYRGHCLVHAAEVLKALGRWHEGIEAARAACGRLADPVPSIRGAALALEADLLRLLGDHDQAEAAYTAAHRHGHEPQPGLALLELDRGRPADAATMIARVLAETEAPISRSRLLAPAVEILLATGDVEAARDAADELHGIAAELGGAVPRAVASLERGAVLLAEGAATLALIDLRNAVRAFTDLGANELVPRTRLLIGQACRAVGDVTSAELEEATARAVHESFRRMGNEVEPTDRVNPPDGLTAREIEVLRHLADGSTNREIGEVLFISEKTVASHVSHIFTKLGIGSRSAATAYAYAQRLVGADRPTPPDADTS